MRPIGRILVIAATWLTCTMWLAGPALATTITWDAVTEDVTGNQELGIAEYCVKTGTTSGVYDTSVCVSGSTTSYTFPDGALEAGTTLYFAVTAVDLSGNVSDVSDEVVYAVGKDGGAGSEGCSAGRATTSWVYALIFISGVVVLLRRRHRRVLVAATLASAGLMGRTASAAVPPMGDCTAEGGLGNRQDILLCEPWDTADWYTHGFTNNDGKVAAAAADVDRTEVVSAGCVSGNCLKVRMLAGESKALSVKWHPARLGLAPDELYMRYYIKLGSNWNPNMCDGGTIIGAGGKFPGLADERVPSDPAGQCGNGGDPSDGINCWSHRTVFGDCYSGDGTACSSKPGATMRFGSYAYVVGQEDATGSVGFWDGDDWAPSRGDGGTCDTTPNNFYCGSGDGGVFVNGVWYLVELFVKMNTPGAPDGVIRGWIDGVPSFEKTNVVFRLPGHDNLHVRTVWMNVYKGGVYGNCNDSEIYLDQMVIASGGQVGAFSSSGVADSTAPKAPAGVRVL